MLDISGTARLSDISAVIISGFRGLCLTLSSSLGFPRANLDSGRHGRARDWRYFLETLFGTCEARGHLVTSRVADFGHDSLARARARTIAQERKRASALSLNYVKDRTIYGHFLPRQWPRVAGPRRGVTNRQISTVRCFSPADVISLVYHSY